MSRLLATAACLVLLAAPSLAGSPPPGPEGGPRPTGPGSAGTSGGTQGTGAGQSGSTLPSQGSTRGSDTSTTGTVGRTQNQPQPAARDCGPGSANPNTPCPPAANGQPAQPKQPGSGG